MNAGINIEEYRIEYNKQLKLEKSEGNQNLCDKDGNKITIQKKKGGGKNFYEPHFTQWLNSQSKH